MTANTYVALDKVTASGSVSQITFTSIPSTYTDLTLVIQGANTNVANARWKLNGDTGTNYSWTGLGGTGSSAVSTRVSNTSTPQLDWYGYFDAAQSNLIAHFMNYSSTTTYKTVLTRSNNSANGTAATIGVWRNTAAITSIEIVSSNGNWDSGSTFSLYGIAASSVGAKATGGAIYSDSTYYYHVFSASGTFAPTQSVSADVLVVAGGGGSSCYYGGAGGAGGFRTFTSQTVSTSQTVTVGAGGAGVNEAIPNKGNNSSFGSLTSTGGGQGNCWSRDTGRGQGLGYPGGSGGGASLNFQAGGAGNEGGYTPVEGYAAGSGGKTGGNETTGGGGGAGAVGGNAGNGTNGGNGGVGLSTAISGGAATGVGELSGGVYYFAGGGGGGSNAASGVAGTGGLGGGGVGGKGNGAGGGTVGANGLANTGGGAGGSARETGLTGGSGGSGIVIVRYAKA